MKVHIKNTHDHINYDFTSSGNTGPGTIHTEITIQKPSPAEILRNLLQKLPTPNNHNDNEITHAGEYDHIELTHDHKNIQQYDIPNDPIPPFKPVKTYDLSEILSNPSSRQPTHVISQTHTIATAYGQPIDDYNPQKNTLTKGFSNNFNSNSVVGGGYYNKIPTIKQYPIPPSPNSFTIYQQMAHKRDVQSKQRIHKPMLIGLNQYKTMNKSKNQFIIRPAPPTTDIVIYPTNTVDQMDKHVIQQQLKEFQNTFNNGFEIQKSIGYELQNPNPNQIKRRIDETILE